MIFCYAPDLQTLERLGFTLRPADWRRMWGSFREFVYARIVCKDAAAYATARAKLAAAKDVQIVHERRPD